MKTIALFLGLMVVSSAHSATSAIVPPAGTSYYAHLNRLFETGTLPGREELRGWWLMNCYNDSESDVAFGAVLMGFDGKPAAGPGGQSRAFFAFLACYLNTNGVGCEHWEPEGYENVDRYAPELQRLADFYVDGKGAQAKSQAWDFQSGSYLTTKAGGHFIAKSLGDGHNNDSYIVCHSVKKLRD